MFVFSYLSFAFIYC